MEAYSKLYQGLQGMYNVNDEFTLHLRMLCTLAVLPPNDLANGFDKVCDEIRNDFGHEADDLLDYFEDTYVGWFRHNAPRRNPRFPIALWNMFHRADQELPRTNSSIEGWHRSFQGHLLPCHQSFWKFLGILKKEKVYVRASILQDQGGHPAHDPRRRYADCNTKILRILDDYPNRPIINYLRSIAHNLAF